MHSKVSSDWLPSNIKATRPVLEIFKMAGYFLDSPHMCSVGPDGEGYELMWSQLGDVWGGPSPATSTDQVYMSTLSFLLDPSNP
jgi:hypothetical protein